MIDKFFEYGWRVKGITIKLWPFVVVGIMVLALFLFDQVYYQ